LRFPLAATTTRLRMKADDKIEDDTIEHEDESGVRIGIGRRKRLKVSSGSNNDKATAAGSGTSAAAAGAGSSSMTSRTARIRGIALGVDDWLLMGRLPPRISSRRSGDHRT